MLSKHMMILQVQFNLFLDFVAILSHIHGSAVLLQVHLISLFHAASRDAILERHHSKVVDWLADADPPVPSHVAWKVLETGRERFKLVRAR